MHFSPAFCGVFILEEYGIYILYKSCFKLLTFDVVKEYNALDFRSYSRIR